MEPKSLIIIYVLLLVLTIVAVIAKKTHWSGIILVAIFPIYFIWIIIDVLRPTEDNKQEKPSLELDKKDEDISARTENQITKSNRNKIPVDQVKMKIIDKLRRADSTALQNTNSLLAVAILYENPSDIALPDKQILAEKLIEQYKPQGWIPQMLYVDQRTPVVARQLIYGQEISENAGLDTTTSNKILADMLADQIPETEADHFSAIAFLGESMALGQTFFAVVAN